MQPETSSLNETEQIDDEQTSPTPVDLNTPAIDTVTIKSTLHNLHSSSPKATTTTLSSTTTKTATTLTIKKTTLSTTSTTTSTELANNDTSSAASKQYLTSEPVETSSITAASSETGATPRYFQLITFKIVITNLQRPAIFHHAVEFGYNITIPRHQAS